ncbi:hypothetical protein D3C76_1416190 [compost metagenome]
MHAEHVERALAPGNQPLQRGLELLAGRLIALTLQGEVAIQFGGGRDQLRQAVHGRQPALEVAMAIFDLGLQLRSEGLAPGLQGRASQLALQAGEGETFDHGRAIIEEKLRHWNHSTTLEKPASSRRWRWVSKVSGRMTFSMAVRFWAISRSL